MPLGRALPPLAAPAAGSATSAASSQNTSRRSGLALAQKAIERHRVGDLGEAEDAALLGGLDDIGAHPLAVDPRDLGEAGQDRLQSCRAHFDRLLHHVVEPGMLQRREHIGDVGQAVLRPGLAARSSGCRAACGRRSAACHSPSRPLNTSTVSPAAEPQHVAEIIALVRARARPSAPGAQGGVDEQAGRAKVEFRHV